MILRRGLYWAQFAFAVGLPLWVLVNRGILAGIENLAIYVVLSPLLFIALAVLTGLTIARKRVRTTHAVSWVDAASLSVVWIATLGYSLLDIPLLAIVVVLSIVAAFWVAIVQLVTETRDRVKGYLGPRNDAVLLVPAKPVSR